MLGCRRCRISAQPQASWILFVSNPPKRGASTVDQQTCADIDHRPDRCRIAGRFDDEHILLSELLREGLESRTANVDAPSCISLPSSRATASAKARWISNPMMRMPPSPISVRSKWELAGGTTSTDPRSRRILESRKGRPCNGARALSPLSISGLFAPSCSRLPCPG